MANYSTAFTAIDLFAGCGGSTLGLKRAGYKVLAAVESDPLAAETYAANHPEVALWTTDIRDLRPIELATELGLEPGALTLVAGCPPCQGFSRIRNRNGTDPADDPRNQLVADFCRFVDVLRPCAVLMENVPGLSRYEGLPAIASLLRSFGYSMRIAEIDAADYGVPQRRKRLILVASVIPQLELRTPSAQRRTVRQAIGGLPSPGSSGDPVHDAIMVNGPRIRRLISRIPTDGGSRLDLPDEDQLDCHVSFDGFKDVYGRMSWDDVAPTITGGCVNPSKGRFLHPESDRVITLREAALLQSFPEDYYFSMRRGRYAAAQMIGNALPPLLGQRLATQILFKLDGAMDCFTPDKRSQVMSAVPNYDTAPELRLRSRLWKSGLRYRKHLLVAGSRPDIVFTRQRLAIFVDGCFWHGCPHHYEAPKTNTSFWDDKIQANRSRDEAKRSALEDAGWNVLRFWECEVVSALEAVVDEITFALREPS